MPDRGDDAVEAVVVKWKRLGIAFKPVDPDLRLGSAFAAIAIKPGEKSKPVTRAPSLAAGMLALPVPQATSSTSIPGSMPARCTRTSAMEVTFSATAW